MAATALLIAAMTATVGFGVDAFVVLPSFTTVSDTNYIFISVGGSKSSMERKNGVDRKREENEAVVIFIERVAKRDKGREAFLSPWILLRRLLPRSGEWVSENI